MAIHLEKVESTKIKKPQKRNNPTTQGVIIVNLLPSNLFLYVDLCTFKTQDNSTHNTLYFVLFA